MRVADVEHAAIKFAGGASPAPATSPLPTARARGDVSIAAAAKVLAKSGPALTAAGGLATGIAAIAQGAGPVQWALGGGMFLGAVCGAVWFLRGQMSKAAA